MEALYRDQGGLSMSPIETSRTYQLWVINDTEDVISAGVLGNDPAPALFTSTGDVAGFALTREVAGGVVSSEGGVGALITVPDLSVS